MVYVGTNDGQAAQRAISAHYSELGGWRAMTDFVSDLLKIQEQIGAQLREADREAATLASADINSTEAVQAIDKELKLKELKRKVDDLVDQVFEIFP
jgi:hypothetical protein